MSVCYSSVKLKDRDTEQSELTAVSTYWTMTAIQKLLRYSYRWVRFPF
jgi:hypothetical protein